MFILWFCSEIFCTLILCRTEMSTWPLEKEISIGSQALVKMAKALLWGHDLSTTSSLCPSWHTYKNDDAYITKAWWHLGHSLCPPCPTHTLSPLWGHNCLVLFQFHLGIFFGNSFSFWNYIWGQSMLFQYVEFNLQAFNSFFISKDTFLSQQMSNKNIQFSFCCWC